MFEEKQQPYLNKETNKWERVVYVFDNEQLSGHPISKRIDLVSEEEVQEFLKSQIPEFVRINPIKVLVEDFYEDEDEFHRWAKESIFVQNLLTQKSLILDYGKITLMEERILKSKNNPDSALTEVTADKLLVLLADLKTKVKNPNG